MNSTIWRCALKTDDLFEKKCPLQWESLKETENTKVRQCDVCNRNVHQCETPDEFIQSTKDGLCISIPSDMDIEGKVYGGLGEPRPWSYELEEHAMQWWATVNEKASREVDQQIHKDLKMKARHRYIEPLPKD